MELLGKNVKEKIEQKIKKYIEKGIRFNAYLVYNSNIVEASIYKEQIRKNLIKFNIPYFEYDISTGKEFSSIIKLINMDELGMGFICRPLKVENEEEIIEELDYHKDPDMLVSTSLGKLAKGNLNYLSGTARAVKEIIEYYDLDVENKNCLVLGRSIQVGLPIYLMLLKKNGNVSIIHSKTSIENITNEVRNSEIIVLATGKRGLVKPEDLNENQIIIDCGYQKDGKGDLGFIPNVKAFTPVPKGVGPVTISTLILNAFEKLI